MGEDDPATTAPKRARARRTADAPVESSLPATQVAGRSRPVIVSSDGSRAGAPVVVEDGSSLAADHVSLHRSAVGRVEAGDVRVEQSAIGAARVDHLTVDRGAVGAAMAGNVEVSRSYARSILARQVQLERGAARVIIAADVQARQSAVMFLIARRVSGDMRVLFDWRGALAFGAAAGLLFSILARVRRRRS